MTANAPGTNHPLRKRTAKAVKRQEEFAAKLMAENPSLSKEEAMAIAQQEMRDNGRGDWRAG
jgi:hypothetical protein